MKTIKIIAGWCALSAAAMAIVDLMQGDAWMALFDASIGLCYLALLHARGRRRAR